MTSLIDIEAKILKDLIAKVYKIGFIAGLDVTYNTDFRHELSYVEEKMEKACEQDMNDLWDIAAGYYEETVQ